jgi:hypothetical protein
MINSVVEFVRVTLEDNRIFGDLLDEAVDLWAIVLPGSYILSCRHYNTLCWDHNPFV